MGREKAALKTLGTLWVVFILGFAGCGRTEFTLVDGLCGNGELDEGEECDDGNYENDDACLSTCVSARCGDGVVWVGTEECDDGNLVPGDGCDESCLLETPVCGNGIVESGEECDDGNGADTDACLSTCLLAECGDGQVWQGVEECDDGNTISGDGCDATCRLEAGECGNGVIEGGEDCDGANLSGQTCETLGYESGELSCSDDCRFDATECIGEPVCGNGIIEAGEECDDGNTISGDGCSSSCEIEFGFCGNNVQEPGEECDGQDLGEMTCELLGYDGGVLACNPVCDLDVSGCLDFDCGNGILDPGEECDDGNDSNNDGCTSSCLFATCGDGYIYAGVEVCDDGNNVDCDGCRGDCARLDDVCGDGLMECGEECDDGNTTSGDGCDGLCQIEAGQCGNGVMEPGEECDGWDLGGQTCETLGYDGGVLFCSALCSLETSGCYNVDCGNGVLDPGEECDDGNDSNFDACLNDCVAASCGDGYIWWGVENCDDGNTTNCDGCHGDCSRVDALCSDGITECGEECDDGNIVSGDGCSAACELEGPVCGNGVVDPGEDCDGGELGGMTCESLGFDGGSLSCTAGCSFDLSGCEDYVCGNGVLDPGESCDDGNTFDCDGCHGDCTRPDNVCGDGISECGEECDDGNLVSGDGCSAACVVETPECGDGALDPGEICDDGNNTNCDGCHGDCSRLDAICGDGISECGEECDDGNTISGDGCSAVCELETATCGNGTLDPGEICDDGNNTNCDGCHGDCSRLDDLCGDGIFECGEECDDGNTISGDGCSAVCELETATCGNGTLDPGEGCDDGNTVNCDGCAGDCSRPDAVCGDGILECGEECDDGNTISGDGCSSTCELENPLCDPDWTLTCNGVDNWSTTWPGATQVVDSYSCVGWDESGPEYAYTFEPQESGEVEVQLSGMTENLDVFVLEGATGCNPQACIAYGDLSTTFDAQAGETYYIVVDGRNGASGNYAINVYCSNCGNGVVEYGEECDEGPANQNRFGLTIWQENGIYLPIHPIQRWTTASTFYAYVSASSHTGYEAVGRSLAFLYRDYDTGILSLFVIHGVDENTSGEFQPTAEVVFDVYDLPTGTWLNRSDDMNEFTQDTPTSYYGDWWFQANTDGGVIEGISYPDGWEIVLEPTWDYGLWEWVWVDENNSIHELDMSKPLYITAEQQSVPCREDCTLPVCGDGILDPGEMCDDGNTQGGGDGCAADCSSMP